MERFLQGTGGLQNRELLMMHYLQQANYVPALQLNHTLKMNMVVRTHLHSLLSKLMVYLYTSPINRTYATRNVVQVLEISHPNVYVLI